MDHYLSNLVPNGIVKISNGNSMIQFGLEIKNGYMREMIRQSTEMMVNNIHIYQFFNYDQIYTSI